MSTETKDVQMFFPRQLTGLEATLILSKQTAVEVLCNASKPCQCLCSSNINSCVHSCSGSSDSVMVVVTIGIYLCSNLYLHGSMQWAGTLCPVTIWRVNSVPFKHTAGFHVGKLMCIKRYILMLCTDLKLKKDGETVLCSSSCSQDLR